MHRYVAFGATAVTVVGATSVVGAAPAQANVYYPGGCRNFAYGIDWRATCYVGRDGGRYINSGGLVVGVGNIVGRWDGGVYGSNIEHEIAQVQFWNGLAVDGIIGPNTWSALQGYMWNCGIADSTYAYYETSYYNDQSERCGYAAAYAFRFPYVGANKYRWQAFDYGANKYVWMSS